MKTCVLIPAYNEAKNIDTVVRPLRRHNLAVVVIDDGSEDNTADIAQRAGAIVIRNKKNLGKGASLIKGFDYALRENFDAVVTVDADGQHAIEDILNCLSIAQKSEGEIFIGNRMGNISTMPLIRRLTNRFTSWVLSKVCQQYIPDSQCGMRLIKKDLLRKMNFQTSKYEIESEIIVRAAELGYKIESLPIKTVYGSQKSQINPLLDTLRFFRFILRYIWITQT
jgi:glycosyltransferase involved in cell wall biosynthesis